MGGRQSKILSNTQQRFVLSHIENSRHPLRNRLIFLLSFKGGLRAKEIAELDWSSVTNAEGVISKNITVYNDQSKGGYSGRSIPMAKAIYTVLIEYKALLKSEGRSTEPKDKIIFSERGNRLSAHSIVNLFRRWYQKLGLNGCSSHSGRRTFITNCSKKIGSVGGSLRDVQQLVGHSNLNTTQRYIEFDKDCTKKLIDMI